MEIVKYTGKEIVLKDELFTHVATSLLFVFPWIGIPLFISLIILSEMGIISVSCQRVEPTQVNCQVNNSKYLGLTQGSSTSLTRVKEAKFNSQNSSDSSNYFVTLVTQKGKEVVSWQSNLSFTNVKGYPQEMNQMVAKINTFINNSTEPSLLIQYDLRWKWQNLLPLTICIIFLGIGILILYAVFSLKILIYLKTLILNKSERQLTYKVFYLFGTETKHYSFAHIQKLILESYTNSDEDENKSYRLELVLPGENLNHQLKITLKYNDNIKRIKKSATMFSDFIEIPYQDLSNK
ncbi:MAG: hypothetical protein F6K54_30265 [Okeania sp. SIO3B5]|uniref:hypothetical protein n=1 Tax=Okeania sp. SIO3B5 TaxID=2607811 RepID=UPI0013FEEAE2|nr:hypothetical protein [Okeania sp. SIO3B5]NEO56981.1 hypothetical protein [Okeania sp. SIO3B5]